MKTVPRGATRPGRSGPDRVRRRQSANGSDKSHSFKDVWGCRSSVHVRRLRVLRPSTRFMIRRAVNRRRRRTVVSDHRELETDRERHPRVPPDSETLPELVTTKLEQSSRSRHSLRRGSTRLLVRRPPRRDDSRARTDSTTPVVPRFPPCCDGAATRRRAIPGCGAASKRTRTLGAYPRDTLEARRAAFPPEPFAIARRWCP